MPRPRDAARPLPTVRGAARRCLLVLSGPLLLALAAGAAAQGVPIRIDERGIRNAGVELGAAAPETGATELTVPGAVAVPPHQLRAVAAPAAGLVEALLAAPDEPVAVGQPLALLRSNELVEAQRAYLEALTRDALARNSLRRDEALLRERIIAERRVVATRAEAEAAGATLEERRQMLSLLGMAEADLQALRERRRIAPSLVVSAPAEGVVLQRQAVAGERVAQAAPLFTIAQLDPLWVNLQVPLAAVGTLAPGARMSLPAQGLEGLVLRIGRSVDPATQSVAVTAEVRGTMGRLRPGQAVTVTVAVPIAGGPLWRVPAGATVRHREQSWLFVRTATGFEARPVVVVAETAQWATIRATLVPGERIATRGVLPLLAALTNADAD